MRRAEAWLLAAALLGACGHKKGGGRGHGDGGSGVVLVDPRKLADQAAPEIEPNDTLKQAQPVAAQAGGPGPFALDVSGTLDASDVDWFQFRVGAPWPRHALSIRVSGAPGADLAAEVHDLSGKLLFDLDDAGIGDPEGAPNLALEAGTYAIKLRLVAHKAKKKAASDAGVAGPAAYTLHIREFEPPAGEELEPNDAPAFAAALGLGDSITGYLGWRKDHDVYKIALGGPADGGLGDAGAAQSAPLKIELDPPPGVTPELTLYDATEAKLLERRGRAGQPLIAGGLLPRAGDPYVFVAVGSGGGKNADEKYTLHVEPDTVAAGAEREPNDTPDSAVILGDATPQKGPGGSATGTLGAGDVDYYRLAVAGGQLVTVEITPQGDGDVALAVVGEGGKPVRVLDEAGKNGAEVLAGWAFPADGTLLLRVSAGGKSRASEFPYRLTWAIEPDDGKSEREPDDDFAHAMPIADLVRGTLASRADVNFYRLTSLLGVSLKVSVATPARLPLALTLYDESRKVVASAASPAGGGAFELGATVDPLRTYTIKVGAPGDAGAKPAKAKLGKPAAPLPHDTYELIVHTE